MKPIEFMLHHKREILEAFEETGSIKKAYSLLCGRIPGFDQIAYNTFKVKADVLVAVTHELCNREQELDSVLQKLHDKKQELQSVTQELYNTRGQLEDVTQELHNKGKKLEDESGESIPPRNFMGWTIHRGKDGYIRLHRRINGKLHTIYGGKTLDPERVERKIREKEANV